MLSLSFTESDILSRQKDCLQYLRDHRVSISISSGDRKRILAILEHGAPSKNIPPRPVIDPALNQPAAKQAISNALNQAVESACNGDMSGTVSGLEAAGAAGVAAIQAYIDAGVPPPNAPSTASRKGFNKPLVDTGELYRSFTYEIRRKG